MTFELAISRGLRAATLAMALGLAACAGDVAKPKVLQDMSAAQRDELKVASVKLDKAEKVTLASYDMARFADLIRQEVAARGAGRMLPDTSPDGTNVTVFLTDYDEGSAVARAMLAGLGQIHIDGDVTVTDRKSGAVLATYKVSKQFAFGGIIGASTNIRDVEKGFAKSVAETVFPSDKK